MIADVAAITWTEYKSVMAGMYKRTHGAYGYPFEEDNPPREPPHRLGGGQREEKEREQKFQSTRKVPKPRKIARTRNVHFQHMRNMGLDPIDAARVSMEDEHRYRIGWNNHFSIMPLDAKGRPYSRWPRV